MIRKAIDFIYENPEEAKNIYFDYTGSDKEDVLNKAVTDATVPCFTFDLSMSADYYDQLQKWMKETGKIDRVIDPEVYWTNKLSL